MLPRLASRGSDLCARSVAGGERGDARVCAHSYSCSFYIRAADIRIQLYRGTWRVTECETFDPDTCPRNRQAVIGVAMPAAGSPAKAAFGLRDAAVEQLYRVYYPLPYCECSET